MKKKDQLRKKFITLRKRKYFNISNEKFYKLITYIKKKNKTKKNFSIGLYYPSNYEINIFNIIDNFKKTKIRFLLPRIQDNNVLKFFVWKKNDILSVNRFGIPEPYNTQKSFPPRYSSCSTFSI